MNTSILDKYASFYKTDTNNVESLVAKKKLIERINLLKNDAHHQYIYNLIKEYSDKYNANVKKLPSKGVSIPYKGKCTNKELLNNDIQNNTNIEFDLAKLPIELQNLIYFLVIDCENQQ
jgi:hypothetical protein